MLEYSSVSASSYDVDSLVAKLNERAADGWDVVTVVSTGGEVAAILRREASGAASAGYTASADAASAAVSEPVAAAVVEAAPVVETPSPVSEPAGWAAEPEAEPTPAVSYEPTPAPAVSYEPTPAVSYEPAPSPVVSYEPTPAVSYEPTPASPIEVSTPQVAAPVNPAPVVTTPAGWYPDPSGRFEMRYWDGTAWTEHVSRQGQQFTDPPVA